MTKKEYAWAAVDMVIDFAAENGIKYRRGDFSIAGEIGGTGEGIVTFLDGDDDKNMPKGVTVLLSFLRGRNGKVLKLKKDDFLSYKYCRVTTNGVFFNFSINEIDIANSEKGNGADKDKIDNVVRRVQKLLALADMNKNPSEEEAIAASMQAQRLLAKYNMEIADITGDRQEKSQIEQVIADVGTGKKWKYSLAETVARSYRCKVYFVGAEQVVFYGFENDVLIARRVFVYLFKVGNTLANKYVKQQKGDVKGLYNSFCVGFCHGVDSELQKNCKALMLITPKEVTDEFKNFSANFGTLHKTVSSNDNKAYDAGVVEGRRALTARYLESAE